MEIQINKKENVAEVSLIGRLDTPASLEAAPAFAKIEEEDTAGTVVLNCCEMSYISSSGLRLFLSLRKAAASKGGKIIVKGINKDIRNVFMMTGFLNLFEIQD